MKEKSIIWKNQLQLEYMRIKNLSSTHSKKLLFIDSETCEGNNIISFYRQTSDSKLCAIDPSLHFDPELKVLQARIKTCQIAVEMSKSLITGAELEKDGKILRGYDGKTSSRYRKYDI